jgi:Fungal specific transcription factor domain
MSIHSVVVNAAADTVEGPSSSTPGQTWVTTPSSIESELPPYDLLYSIVDLYFKHVNTWSPILDRKEIFDRLFGLNVMAEEDRVLAHAIVATALRFSRDPRLTQQSRRRYHDVSKQRVQLYALNNPTVRALQSLVILALDVLGTSNGPQGASILALIAQNIVHLGLGREKGVFLESPACPSIGTVQAFVLPQPKSWIEDEERRRLFWMTYILDRYATIDTAFDFALNEREMDRALPCRYDQFSENVPVETKWFRWTERSETIINKPENLGR